MSLPGVIDSPQSLAITPGKDDAPPDMLTPPRPSLPHDGVMMESIQDSNENEDLPGAVQPTGNVNKKILQK